MEPNRPLREWLYLTAVCLMAIIAGGLAYLFLNVDFIPRPASMQRGHMFPLIQDLFSIAGIIFAIIVAGYSLLFSQSFAS